MQKKEDENKSNSEFLRQRHLYLNQLCQACKKPVCNVVLQRRNFNFYYTHCTHSFLASSVWAAGVWLSILEVSIVSEVRILEV